MINLLEVIQDKDKAKAISNLDYITLALDNVELGFRQFLLDLPLDYHDKETEALVEEAIQKLQFAANKYRRAL